MGKIYCIPQHRMAIHTIRLLFLDTSISIAARPGKSASYTISGLFEEHTVPPEAMGGCLASPLHILGLFPTPPSPGLMLTETHGLPGEKGLRSASDARRHCFDSLGAKRCQWDRYNAYTATHKPN